MATVAAEQPELAAAFARDGCAVLERFLGPAEVEHVRADVEPVLAAPLPAGCERPHNTLAPLHWSSPMVERLLACESRQARVAEATAAQDLRWISAYVSVKEPHSPPLWWHQDWWCWDHPVSYRRAPAQVAVLCYLADTDADSAALRVLPGTHARSAPLHRELPEAHAQEAGSLDPGHVALSDQPGQITLEVRAGDAIVTDYRLLHGTHANTSPRRRDCVILSFAPSWRRLPAELRAHLVRHPALPGTGERPPAAWPTHLLPDYAGTPRDLPLSRVAPSEFAVDPA